MEKMFVYPDDVASAIAAEKKTLAEPMASTAGAVSLQCKRFRAVLEQCLESPAVAARTPALARGQFDGRFWVSLQKRVS